LLKEATRKANTENALQAIYARKENQMSTVMFNKFEILPKAVLDLVFATAAYTERDGNGNDVGGHFDERYQ